MNKKLLSSFDATIFGGALLGVWCGYVHNPLIIKLATGVSEVFVNFLQLISLPIVFLSIVSTLSNMQSIQEMRTIGKKIVSYTVLTTLIAASVALFLFRWINPLSGSLDSVDVSGTLAGAQTSYLQFILNIIPSNIVQAMGNNQNVMSVVFVAVLFGISILSLEDEHKKPLQTFFKALFASILKITMGIMYVMPVGVWAFVTSFVHSMYSSNFNMESIGWYVVCIILANLIQAFVVLPLFLWTKGISARKTAHGMMPALTTAFFSKSSNVALPFSLRCAEKNLKLSKRVSSIAFPLCAVINMNGCAAFIVITVLFVGMHGGLTFTLFDQLMWVVIASTAAIGNAGVPMGCFFLSTALLNGMGVPVNILLVILPIYTLIDMVETTLNVWSDACVASVVSKEVGT